MRALLVVWILWIGAGCSGDNPADPDTPPIATPFTDPILQRTLADRDLSTLRELTLVDQQIADLQGLEKLTGLEALDLSANQIADIAPLAGLTQLRFLKLTRNQIVDIGPLTGLTQLQALFLEDNRIRDIAPLLALDSLVLVDLTGNPLDSTAAAPQISTLQTKGVDLIAELAVDLPTPTTPAPEPPATEAPADTGDKLLFNMRADFGQYGLFAINADGSGLERIFAGLTATHLIAPATPDGRRFVTGVNQRVFVADFGNTDAREVARGAFGAFAPVWLGDDRVYYFVAESSGFKIYTVDAEGNNRGEYLDLQDVAPFGLILDAASSPDGTRIAFSALVSGDGNVATQAIYLVDAESTILHLTPFSNTSYGPAWSPDGERVAFSSLGESGDLDIYAINRDGTNLVQLTSAAGVDADPAWSPDGTRIAFFSLRDGNSEIYTVAATGGAPTRLTRDSGQDVDPLWSSDGTRIYFSSDRGGAFEVYAIESTGSTGQTPRALTRDTGGARLAFVVPQ